MPQLGSGNPFRQAPIEEHSKHASSHPNQHSHGVKQERHEILEDTEDVHLTAVTAAFVHELQMGMAGLH